MTVNKKIKAALGAGLLPIVCVGEKLEERETGRTFKVVEDHVSGAFKGLAAADASKIIIAYEPVWAIGTGKTASPEQAEVVHRFIREWIERQYGAACAARLVILYGGSVTPQNVTALMAQPNINGALVGGASLDVDSFVRIIGY